MRQIHIFTESTNSVANEQLSDWVSHQIWGEIRSFGPHASLGVFNPHIIGGVIFHDYQPERGTIEISAAGHGWLSRRAVNAIMDFVFNKLGCQMLLAQAASNNANALALDRRIFAHEVVIPRLMGRDIDGHIFTLTAEEWLTHPLYKGE